MSYGDGEGGDGGESGGGRDSEHLIKKGRGEVGGEKASKATIIR